ncbi:MAG: hypothetical protein AAF211_26920 [Myxococcota bacterium]
MRQWLWIVLVGCNGGPVEETPPEPGLPLGSWVYVDADGSCIRFDIGADGLVAVESAATVELGATRLTERAMTFGTWTAEGTVRFEAVDIIGGGTIPAITFRCAGVEGGLQCEDDDAEVFDFVAAEPAVAVTGWRTAERDNGQGTEAWPMQSRIEDQGRSFDVTVSDGLSMEDDGTAFRVLTEVTVGADQELVRTEAFAGTWTDDAGIRVFRFANSVYDLDCEEIQGTLQCTDGFGTSSWTGAALPGEDVGVGPLCPAAVD